MVYDDIEWFANGERANEETLNRPLKQLVNKIDKTQLDLRKTVTKYLEVTDTVKTTDADGKDGLGTVVIEGSVDITKHIVISQTATIEDNINFNSTIITKDNNDVAGAGSIAIDGTVIISKALGVSGDVEMASNISVGMDAEFKGDVKTSGKIITVDADGVEGSDTLEIKGNVDISENLLVNKEITINGNKINSVDNENGVIGDSTIEIVGGLNITKNLTLKNTIKALNEDNKLTLDNHVVITKSLEVLGDIVKMNSNVIEMSDNIILLNADQDSEAQPNENVGFEVNRGSEENVQLRWNETASKWEITVDGVEYYPLLTKKDFHFEYKEHDIEAEEDQYKIDLTYIPGQIQIFVEGIKLKNSTYEATDGETIFLENKLSEGDWVNIVTW